MRNDIDALPTSRSMRADIKVRRARRGNDEHNGRRYLANKPKPWKNNTRRAAA